MSTSLRLFRLSPRRMDEILVDPESGWENDYYEGADGNVTISQSGYDLIHRLLTGDWLDLDAPLSSVIWGGHELAPPHDENWCYLNAQDVKEISRMLEPIDNARLMELFEQNYVDDDERGFVHAQRENYRAWVSEDYAKVRSFYSTAAAAGDAVLKDIG